MINIVLPIYFLLIKKFLKVNRDMNKCIFICHEKEFFNAPKNNILQLTEFNGEESDREIIFLCKELMRIKNDEIKDITQILPEISSNVIV